MPRMRRRRAGGVQAACRRCAGGVWAACRRQLLQTRAAAERKRGSCCKFARGNVIMGGGLRQMRVAHACHATVIWGSIDSIIVAAATIENDCKTPATCNEWHAATLDAWACSAARGQWGGAGGWDYCCTTPPGPATTPPAATRAAAPTALRHRCRRRRRGRQRGGAGVGSLLRRAAWRQQPRQPLPPAAAPTVLRCRRCRRRQRRQQRGGAGGGVGRRAGGTVRTGAGRWVDAGGFFVPTSIAKHLCVVCWCVVPRACVATLKGVG